MAVREQIKAAAEKFAETLDRGRNFMKPQLEEWSRQLLGELAVAALRGQRVEAKVVMDGVLIAREDPEGGRAFGQRMKELIALGNK